MSEFAVPIVKIGPSRRHENADSLSITDVEGYPVIFRTGEFQEGDLAIYIPGDAVLNMKEPWVKECLSFLTFKQNGTHRVKAIRLRGVFSMGILVPAKAVFKSEEIPVGDPVDGISLREWPDVSGVLGIVKYEEPIKHDNMKLGGKTIRDPGIMPIYGVENYRKYRRIFQPEHEVVVTEKIHGCNGRIVHDGEQLWVGSHKCWKLVGQGDVWNTVVQKYELDIKLARFPKMGIFGEVFGDLQDLKYGLGKNEVDFRIFDVFNVATGRFEPWSTVEEMASNLGLQTVPVLYRGPFNAAVIEPLADGDSVLAPGQIREGIVVKTTNEVYNDFTHRTIAKLVSEAYHLRKGNTTEYH